MTYFCSTRMASCLTRLRNQLYLLGPLANELGESAEYPQTTESSHDHGRLPVFESKPPGNPEAAGALLDLEGKIERASQDIAAAITEGQSFLDRQVTG